MYYKNRRGSNSYLWDASLKSELQFKGFGSFVRRTGIPNTNIATRISALAFSALRCLSVRKMLKYGSL